jgi:hypothetical protein
MEDVKIIDGQYYKRINTLRFAQQKAGQKLHLVYDFGDNSVSRKALCGKSPDQWRMTINLPMGMACHNCLRVHQSK